MDGIAPEYSQHFLFFWNHCSSPKWKGVTSPLCRVNILLFVLSAFHAQLKSELLAKSYQSSHYIWKSYIFHAIYFLYDVFVGLLTASS